MDFLCQAYEFYSSPGPSSEEGSYGQRLDEESSTLKKYKALQQSVCFLCLFSMGSDGKGSESSPLGSRNSVEVIHKGSIVRVRREIDLDRILEDKLPAAMFRCPPACIGPVEQELGVGIVDELEMLAYMECELALGSGVLVDARTPDVHKKGTIPGSINIPYTVFHQDSDTPELVQALGVLAVKPKGAEQVEISGSDGTLAVRQPWLNGAWDFSAAKNIVLWCSGPLGQQSPMAIMGLRKIGYPREKIFYYRGGLQLWRAFDLNIVMFD